MTAPDDEWSAALRVIRASDTRHPALFPPHSWLGLVQPGAHLRADLTVTNDTYQSVSVKRRRRLRLLERENLFPRTRFAQVCWWASTWRWWRENVPHEACAHGSCGTCRDRRCTCELLRPTRGALQHGAQQRLAYDVNAPEVSRPRGARTLCGLGAPYGVANPQSDGCVATLVSVRRTACDLGVLRGAAGVEGRAALLAYRVLAPRVALRVHAWDDADCDAVRDGTDCGERYFLGGTQRKGSRRGRER